MDDSNNMIAIDLNSILSSGVSPEIYQYYESRMNYRTLILNDEVSASILEWIVYPLQNMDNDGSGEPIYLKINTNGGDTYSGLALCHAIDSIKNCKLTIEISALALSMGSLIAMAGFNNPLVHKICSPYSVFLIHAGIVGLNGGLNSVRDTFNFQEKYEDLITQYVLSHSTITEAEYKEKSRYEWWLTADEALKYNIVNEVK